MNFDNDRFKALIHYICAKVDDPNKLGATKLNKILWYSDAMSFLKWGEPITGEVYEKRQFGPMPSHIYSSLDELVEEDKMVIANVEYFGRTKREYIPLKESDPSQFSAEQISLVDNVIQHICDDHTATSISDATHDAIWKMARIGEPIPLEVSLVFRLGELDGKDMEWARTEAAKFAA